MFNPGHSIEVVWFLLHLCQMKEERDGSVQITILSFNGMHFVTWTETYYTSFLFFSPEAVAKHREIAYTVLENSLVL